MCCGFSSVMLPWGKMPLPFPGRFAFFSCLCLSPQLCLGLCTVRWEHSSDIPVLGPFILGESLLLHGLGVPPLKAVSFRILFKYVCGNHSWKNSFWNYVWLKINFYFLGIKSTASRHHPRNSAEKCLCSQSAGKNVCWSPKTDSKNILKIICFLCSYLELWLQTSLFKSLQNPKIKLNQKAVAFEWAALSRHLLVWVSVELSACCQGLDYLFTFLIILQCY